MTIILSIGITFIIAILDTSVILAIMIMISVVGTIMGTMEPPRKIFYHAYDSVCDYFNDHYGTYGSPSSETDLGRHTCWTQIGDLHFLDF